MKALLAAFLLMILPFGPALTFAQQSTDSLAAQRLQRLEQENRDLRVKMEYLEKLYDRRFDDFTKWLGILIAVIVGGVILAGVNANSAARKQAIEEVQSLRDDIENLKSQATDVVQTITLAEERHRTLVETRLQQRSNDE